MFFEDWQGLIIIKKIKKIFFFNKKSKSISLWVGRHISIKLGNNGQSNIYIIFDLNILIYLCN